MRIRFRVDGVLQETARVPKRMVAGVISRIKIMSELDIAEKRMPQDGRVGVTDRGPPDRPARHHPAHPDRRGGLDPHPRRGRRAPDPRRPRHGRRSQRQRFENSFRKPYGAVLVTGPTGAGKSTTLYAALQELNDVDKHIVTIEDPVEYRLPGVNQIGVHRKAGLTFATGPALGPARGPGRDHGRRDPRQRDGPHRRSRLRSPATWCSPRCTRTMRPGAITRLQEMGIESFLTSSAVECVVAQRLARMLCPQCKRRVVVSRGVAGGGRLPGRHRPRGLRAGRLPALPRLRLPGPDGHLLGDGAERGDQGDGRQPRLRGRDRRSWPWQEGMLTLQQSGLEKVRSGLTSIEEVVARRQLTPLLGVKGGRATDDW